MLFRKEEVATKEFKPRLTYALISVCVLVFIFESAYSLIYGSGAMEELFNIYGFSLESIFAGLWWTPLTSIFLHANTEHLILNIIALFFFGRAVEEGLGWRKCLLVFFASAILGDIAISLTSFLGVMPAGIPTIGASAAVFGLMGTAMLVKPLEFVFYPYLIPVPLVLVALLYTLFNIGEFIAVLVTGAQTEIAYAAHIGGLFAGMLFGFKEEGSKRGLRVLLLIIILLILIPFLWFAFSYLELFNYIQLLTGMFG